MSDLSDDAFDATLRDEEARWVLRQACGHKPEHRKCEWSINEDGLFECSACGVVTDI